MTFHRGWCDGTKWIAIIPKDPHTQVYGRSVAEHVLLTQILL